MSSRRRPALAALGCSLLAACSTTSFQPQFKAPEAPRPAIVASELAQPKPRTERPVAVGLTTDPMRMVAWDLTQSKLLWEIPIDAKSAPLIAADAVITLKVPTTWAEFMANNQKLKAAGHDAVIQSYADTWTSQIFVLADFYNVYAADSNWADKYTKNQVKYGTDPVALQGFQHLQDVFQAGYLNKDFASTSFDKALRKIAAGEGAQYPMLTFAIDTIVGANPEAKNNIGFFAMPGTGKNGLTVWLPGGVYIPKESKHPDEAKKFLAFVASVKGCEAITKAVSPTGPYVVEGCQIPSDVPQAVKDMLPYFEKDGATSPALEFLSPIKGPALEQITVEVGSGIRSAKDGAALYDEDVKKQAQQLKLPGW